MKKIIIWTIVVAIIIGGGAFAYRKATKKTEKQLETAEAKRASIEEVVSVTGSVKSSEKADLSFKASGKIIEIKVEAGDAIKSGQELAGLDTRDLDASAMEAETAVKVAEAQLAEIEAGAQQEEIDAQRVAVANAEINLSKTKESAEKSIASAMAQAQGQEITVESKEQALLDVKASAQDSINSDYETGLSSADLNYLTVFNAVDTINDLYDDDDLMLVFSNLDPQLEIFAEAEKENAIASLDGLKPFMDKADSTKACSDIDSALAELKKTLNVVDDSLDVIYSALLNTQPILNITEAELEAYKTSIFTQRTNVNSAVSTVISSQQAIASQKITNTSAINSAQQALDSANALLTQYQAAFSATEASQSLQVSSAENSLKSAEEQLKLKLAGVKAETIAVYQAKINQTKASFNSILNKYADRTIFAPADGTIAEVYKKEGENVNLGEKTISFLSQNGLEIEIDIPEADIVKVKADNLCRINLDAFSSDEIFEGKIALINPAENVIEGVIYYKAKILFNENDGRIKPGMTANVDIITEKKENVVIIPSKFIEKKNGKQIVKVLRGDKSIEEREIKTGIRDITGSVEITEGLSGEEKITE